MTQKIPMTPKLRRRWASAGILLAMFGIPCLVLYRPVHYELANRHLMDAVTHQDLAGAHAALDAGADPDLRRFRAGPSGSQQSFLDLLRDLIFKRSVGSGLAHGGEEGCGVDAEVDDGDAEGLNIADELGGGGEGVVAVVGGGERADPGVEDLDDVGTGFDLLGGVGDEDGDEFLHQEGPARVSAASPGIRSDAWGTRLGVDARRPHPFR